MAPQREVEVVPVAPDTTRFKEKLTTALIACQRAATAPSLMNLPDQQAGGDATDA
jgi:hypothetical protein